MTLNGVMAVILRSVAEFGSFGANYVRYTCAQNHAQTVHVIELCFTPDDRGVFLIS